MGARVVGRRTACVIALLVLFATVSSRALAQGTTFDVLHQFPQPYGPFSGLTRGSDGNLYGIFPGRLQPAAGGAIFRVGPDTVSDPVTFTVVHDFTAAEGLNPVDTLALGADGRLYGVTSGGGANGVGTLFRLEADNSITVVHAFTSSEVGGATSGPPSGIVQAGDGAFYGVLSGAGTSHAGAIYRVDSAGTFTIAHSFLGDILGGFPSARLTLGPDGNLYGVTPRSTVDFSSKNGTVFRLTPGTLAFATLHSFSAASTSSSPNGPLTAASDGNLYGTATRFTVNGVSGGLDIVYKVGPATPFTTVHSFTSSEGGAVRPALVEGPDGNVYGTTITAFDSAAGMLFRVSPAGVFQSVASFPASQTTVNTLLLLQPDGRLLGIGTLVQGNATLFRVGTDGSYARGVKLIPAAQPTGAGALVDFAGGLVGASSTGGVYGYGALFRRDSNGDITTVHSFSFDDGATPTDLVVGSDGNVYGTTSNGGSAGCGTAFRLSASYVLTTVHHFTCGDDGRFPRGVLRASDGSVYGFTTATTNALAPVVFRIDPVSGYSVLRAFPASETIAGLTQGADGRLYGTEPAAGAGGFGRVFALDLSGGFSVLYEFTGGADGSFPQGITRGPDDALYGVTFRGADGVNSAVYRLSLDGTFAPIHQFTAAEGAFASTPLTRGLDGYLYGVTFGFPGVAFRMSTTGSYEELHRFDGGTSVLSQAHDATLYAIGQDSGPPFLYSLTVPTPTALSAAPASGVYGSTVTLTASLAAAAGPVEGQTVAFSLNGVSVGSAVTNASGIAALAGVSIGGIAAGVHFAAIGASFSGAGALIASTAASAALTVTPGSTTTSVTASASTVDVLQPVTLTANVGPVAPAAGQPTGSVEFRDGGVVLGTAPANAATVTLTVNGLAPGSHTITAAYGGDGNFTGSTSAPVTVTVRSLAAATLTIVFTSGPAALGSRPPISAFVAALGGGTATGSVQFFDTSAGSIGTASLVNGIATISPAGLAVGLHVIVARYAGNAALSPSISSPALLTVFSGTPPVTTTVTLASSGTPATFGQAVTFTATVTPASGTPTGVVVFLVDGTLLGTANVSSSGGVSTGAISSSALSRGVHLVNALFVGGPGFASSTSLPAVQIVQ